MTTTSANSIAYQEYVSRLPYGLAIKVGGLFFDGCDPATGDLLEAKAGIDFMYDSANNIYSWIYDRKNPKYQMIAQSVAATGRSVVWHAQTLKGYYALSQIAENLELPNLSVVYDPN